MKDFSKNQEAFSKLKKPKGIIFDWDNTLVDTWILIQKAIDKTMLQMGREPWGIEKVRDTVHKSMRESFPEIFGNKWEEAGEIYKNSYHEINLNEMVFLDGALNLIKTIDQLGITQFIVSNKIGATLKKEAKNLGVDHLFFTLIGSGDATEDKPSRKPVELALIGSDLDPTKDEIWFIGDTIADVECAYNSNCSPIIYSNYQDKISKTIPQSLAANGRDGNNPIPIYFNHNHLTSLLSSYKT